MPDMSLNETLSKLRKGCSLGMCLMHLGSMGIDASAPRFSLEEPSLDELPAASDLLDLCLGVIPGRAEDLRERVESGETHVLTLRDDGGETFAVGTWEILDHRDIAAKLQYQDIITAALCGAQWPYGWLGVSAVRPDQRRQGIGSLILAERLAALRRAGARTIFAIAWQPPGRLADSHNLLLKEGLEVVAEQEGFWGIAEAEEDYCPHCGAECRCTAVVFRMALSGGTVAKAGA